MVTHSFPQPRLLFHSNYRSLQWRGLLLATDSAQGTTLFTTKRYLCTSPCVQGHKKDVLSGLKSPPFNANSGGWH